jgi:hypothetical protein
LSRAFVSGDTNDPLTDVVATEERKINARKNAAKAEEPKEKSHSSHAPPPKFPEGKDAKDKIVSVSKPAG